LTKSYVSELERGTRTPRLTTLKVLARRLNRPLSYFLDGVLEDREPEALLTIGTAYLHAGSLPEAQAAFDRALDLAAQHDDETLEVRIELSITAVERQLGHAAAARKRVNRCIQALGAPAIGRCWGRPRSSLGGCDWMLAMHRPHCGRSRPPCS